MKRIARKKRMIRILRWVFQRDNQLLTCQLDSNGHHASYTLSLVPHWDVREAVSETFAGVGAFRRHAAVAEQLRNEGWTVAAYSVAR
jgi:stress-induced morphogen